MIPTFKRKVLFLIPQSLGSFLGQVYNYAFVELNTMSLKMLVMIGESKLEGS